MTGKEFVKWINKNAARVTEYKSGGDGSGGKCDCIGLIIGAWRLSGNKWTGTHGSNYAARNKTEGLAEGQPLHLGDLVYKARRPGEAGYKLPDTYKKDPDQNDYYHVGVVTRESPLEITHCTSVPGGIQRDSTRGKWKYSGKLRGISEAILSYTARVTAKSGKTVNLRAKPSKSAKILYRVPIGGIVYTEGEEGSFTRCTYEDEALHVLETGYIQSDFLEYIPDGSETGGGTADGGELVTVKRADLLQLYEIIGKMLFGGSEGGDDSPTVG